MTQPPVSLFLHPEVIQDPYPTYQRFLQETPIYYDETLKAWMLFRYDDVQAALKDTRFSANRVHAMIQRLPEAYRGQMSGFVETIFAWSLFQDPPQHTRVRSLLNRAFAPRLVKNLAQRIDEIVSGLLAALPRGEPVDLLSELANPLPVIVIAELLGTPAEDRDKMKQWSDHIAHIFGTAFQAPDVALRAQQSLLEMKEYCRAIVRQRRQEPQEDLISALLAAEEDGNVLNEEELLAICTMLLFAGHETTTNLLANSLLTLCQHPGSWQQLQAEPTLLDSAIEEFLRFTGPVQRTARLTTEELRLGGQRVPAGAHVYLILAAANRDPAVFESANELVLNRKDNRHVAFGYGTHFCVGAMLARLETRLVFEHLLDAVSEFELATERVTWQPTFFLRALQRLPMILS